ncbi:response regulator, partial [Diaphorobacter ruginosibacter]|uniref:hybrid sensor histidine kinase/response regulator n=1 Tax=Diaphorobacter ruginosibacter TaxID=1715720 RepID=UPI00333EC051
EPIDPGQDVQVQPAGLADGLQVQELSEADFQAFESGSGPEAGADAFEFFAPHASDAEFVQEEDEREAKPGSGQVPAPEPEQELVSEQEQEAELPEPDTQRPGLEAADDSTKVIGSLRISLPLYNVYLGEAEEWSQRLIAELQGWLDDSDRPVPESAIARAHSLAGSSATVGFSGLSDMARLLEHALQHVQPQQYGVPAQLAVFQAVADDIRRLLHQFAAGFLKTPNPQLIGQLQDVLNAELVSGMAPLAALREESGQPASVAAPEPAAQAPQAIDRVQRSHDEFDAVDVVDPDLFPIFEEEAIELLPQLGGALRQWSADPGNLAARSDLLRALHTLKGSARLAGAMRLGEMAHRMESDVEHIDKDAARSEEIEPLLVKLDTLQEAFEALRHPQAEPEWTAGQHEPAEPEAATALEEAPAAVEGPAPQLARPLTLQLAQGRAQAGQTVRVRAPLLDRLVNQAGEVLIARSRLDARMVQMRSSLTDLTGNLERLRQQLRDIEVQAETQMQSRLALSKDTAAGFDPLEFDRFTRVQELTRMMAESVNDVATVQRNLQRAMEGAEDDLVSQGRQARELQRDLLRTRMVEFDSISERLYALVRQSSKETGKQIKLDILGGMIEMDRGVLDRMTPAFEHLLRNCVGHGIESPDARLAAGKPASGSITIALRQEGNDVSVEFRDDGAGLNVVRIREKAVERGLIGADTPVTDVDAANLIFMPGFSTAAEVTGLSGRGIGMDVVRTEVNALGGRIETSSTVGQGSSFRLVLPLTTAVTQVVMLRAGGLSIGVPASLVSVVRRTTAQELASAYATQEFEEGNERLPFYWAGALLQSSPRSTEANAKIRPVVILQSAARRIAMHVDEVLGNQEVVVKNLGPQLSRMPGMAGMSVLASGAVVLIYNPVALATVYGDKVAEAAGAAVQPADADAPAVGAPAAPAALAQAAPQVPLVLVVDDSITVRRVTQRLLQREGYRVSLAADGLQALERLQEERPTVVLSDIEMPRMDGFDLARNIRSDARLKDLPVIMITSRIAEKHREHAMELGVNHYLGKPYSDEELLGLVQHYSMLEAQAEAG